MRNITLLSTFTILHLCLCADDEKRTSGEHSGSYSGDGDQDTQLDGRRRFLERPRGIAFDIDNLDHELCLFNEYHYDGNIIWLIIPHQGVSVVKLLQSSSTIWEISPYEAFDYCKVYLKRGKPGLVVVTKSGYGGVKQTNHVKSLGKWKECVDLVKKMDKLKVVSPTQMGMTINLENTESIPEYKVFEANISNGPVRYFFANLGYFASKVVFGDSLVWKTSGSQRCLACDLYSENSAPLFVLLSIKDHGCVEHKYIGRNADGSWGTAQDPAGARDKPESDRGASGPDSTKEHRFSFVETVSKKIPSKIEFTTYVSKKVATFGHRIGSFRHGARAIPKKEEDKIDVKYPSDEPCDPQDTKSKRISRGSTDFRSTLESEPSSDGTRPSSTSSDEVSKESSKSEKIASSPPDKPRVVRPRVRFQDDFPETTGIPKEPFGRARGPITRVVPDSLPGEGAPKPSQIPPYDPSVINLQHPNNTIYRTHHHYCEEIPTKLILPGHSIVKKIMNGNEEIWKSKPGEYLAYAKAFLNKDGRPEIIKVAIKTRVGIYKKHYKYKNGLWTESRKHFEERIKSLKIATPKEADFAIDLSEKEDTFSCTIFDSLFLGCNLRSLIPKLGYIANEVKDGQTTVWSTEKKDKRCLFCYVYLKKGVAFLLHMKVGASGEEEHAYFEKDDSGGWRSIMEKDFCARRDAME